MKQLLLMTLLSLNAYAAEIGWSGNTFVEIWGVLEESDRELEVLRWEREKSSG